MDGVAIAGVWNRELSASAQTVLAGTLLVDVVTATEREGGKVIYAPMNDAPAFSTIVNLDFHCIVAVCSSKVVRDNAIPIGPR